MALLFRQLSADVIMFQHTAPPLTEEQAEELTARGIAIIAGEVAALDIQDDQLAGVRLRSGECVPRQAVVVAPRFTARADVLTALGLEPTEMLIGDVVVGTFIPADATGATTVPGVWVAGNVTDLMGQVVAVAAAGAKAGAVINADLVAEETALAVAASRPRSTPTRDPFSTAMDAATSERVQSKSEADEV